MKLANLTLVSTMVVLGLVAAGCASKSEGTGSEGTAESLSTNESQLVEDGQEADDADQSMESGVEEPLSGAETANPGSPADGDSDAAVLGKIKTNAGKWFRPAGCMTTTLAGNVATHVFDNCTGPYGLVNFNGTVTSTYVRANGTLTITHEATGFKANGAEISGKRVVTYSKSGSVITKHRTGSWSGTTRKGKPFAHEADFTETWDGAAMCITRDGTAQTTVEAREHSRTITGYKRCGIGNLGCPESGKLTLERTRGADTVSVTVEFLGGRDYTITGSNGRTVTRQLICRE
jgi:hypothetical protein